MTVSETRVRVRGGFPYRSQPTGWFQIGWSRDLAVGQVEPLHYFDNELVMYRGESGTVHVLDAYCPHLGAHLGMHSGNHLVGGEIIPSQQVARRGLDSESDGFVLGDDIVCPWHGWRFSCEGSCVDIPYSTRVNRAVKIPTWHAAEQSGLIYLWHDAAGNPPSWDPPAVEEFTSDDWYPFFTHKWASLTMKPSYLVDNAGDIAHLKYIHAHHTVGHTMKFDSDDTTFSTVIDSTLFTGKGPTPVKLLVDAFGVAGVVVRYRETFNDGTITVFATPIDEDHCDLYYTVSAQREPGTTGEMPSGAAGAYMAYQIDELEKDKTMWENMRYVDHPPFTPEEAPAWVSLRRWFANFYPHE